VVDCDDEVGSTLQRVLAEEADYEVHISTNLFEAGLECERFRPHVLLFDVDMAGDLTDYICNSIQECDELQGIRMVAITSRLTEGQIVQLANRGFDSVLRKPFTVRQVIESVEQAHSVLF
jgi:DNA-binding response OmpR family regulator